MVTAKTFPVLDGDSHVLEPEAIWTEYLEPENRPLARSIFWHEEGEVSPVTVLNGHVAAEPYFTPSAAAAARGAIPHQEAHLNIRRNGVWKPGMTVDDIGGLDPGKRHPLNPGGSDPVARLRDMDLMGIDQALLFPTYFAEYFPVVQDPSVAAALARAYNNWVLDFSRHSPERLLPVAVLPMQEINAAMRELTRVAELGFKAVFIRPLFINGRFPHHRYYYPLWRKIEELGLIYCSHPSCGTSAAERDSSAPFIERVTANLNIGHPVAEAMAGSMDQGILLAGMMGEGLLERFPRIRFYLAHAKASWLHCYREKLESYLWLSIQADPVSLEPEKLFIARSTLINFDSSESAIWEMPDLYENLAAWGSHYPNHDTYTAWESIESFRRHGLPVATIKNLMGENLAKLLGVKPALHILSN